MTRDDAPKFAAQLAAARMAFDRPTDGLVGKVYFRALEDCSLDEVLSAIGSAVKTCERFPNPAQLRQEVRNARHRRALEKSTQEALAGPREPISLPPGAAPKTMPPIRGIGTIGELERRREVSPNLAKPPLFVPSAERLRRQRETWDQSMARLRRQRMALGLTDADVETATKDAS